MENNTSNKNSKLQWQLEAVSEVLGDLSLTIKDSLTVGRGSDNDLVLGSKRVSREHAKLYIVNGQLYIKDLQSSNGTFINEVALAAHKSTKVQADDLIAFANFQFQAKCGTEHTASSTADEATNHTNHIVTKDTESPLTETIDTISDHSASTTDSSTVAEVDSDSGGETITDTVTQPTATSDKPTTPINPIVDDVATDKPVTPQPSETQPVADEASKSIESVVQDTESTNKKVEAPVNPLDTSADSNLEKQNTDKADNLESTADTASSSNDKTTQTTLQQEADPDVLRAKQAATGQFAPAENNDIGTNQNKAVDQAATNPATQPEQKKSKKGSGAWFVWVFLLIVIIAAVVWMLQGGTA